MEDEEEEGSNIDNYEESKQIKRKKKYQVVAEAMDQWRLRFNDLIDFS